MDGIAFADYMVDEAKKLKKKLILFNVDIEKAWDSIRWEYLDVFMLKMGFPYKWRVWIMKCVRPMTSLVLVNGSPIEEFSLGRDLS